MTRVVRATRPVKHLRLPGFQHMKSYWDPTQNIEVVRVLAGEYYVTHCDEMITTVLGSCVSACIRDPSVGIGGINHFMLPAESASSTSRGSSRTAHGLSADAAYGSFAMERLINCILKYGGRRENLEIKLFGGGRIMGGATDVGAQNIDFVHSYLRTDGLKSMVEDVGGNFSRRMAYFPATGKVLLKKLRHDRNETIIQQESAYMASLRREAEQAGDVELFGD